MNYSIGNRCSTTSRLCPTGVFTITLPTGVFIKILMILSIVTSPVSSIGKSTKELLVICHLTKPPSLAVTLKVSLQHYRL
ncbi:MAG: hypothetical protein AB8U53_04525 [Rickettsia aeschlimannii]